VLGWGMMIGFLLHLVPRTAPLGALVMAPLSLILADRELTPEIP